MMTMTRKLAFPALLLVSACTTVGPDYAAPESAVADDWLEPASSAAIDPRWWDNFGDPMLASLIEQALAGSPDVAEARARLAEARANRDAVRGAQLPEAQASGSATQNRLSENGQIPLANVPGFDPEFSLFDLGFDASWEIDFWGRHARRAEVAEARVGAGEAALHDVLVTLTGEIARTYVALREAQAQERAARETAGALAELARLTELRYRAGESSRLEYESAASAAESAEQRVPQATAASAAAAYRLGRLAGQPPEAIVPELLAPQPIPNAPEAILVGVRSELLSRRPDVRRAERELAASSAQIGVATADLFPRFSLLGGLGFQARSVSDLFAGESLRYAIGPSFSWPIFAGGRIRAQIRGAEAANAAALARYEAAVLGALADSESAINGFLADKRREDFAQAALARQQDAFALVEQQFEAGEINRLALEQARLDLVARERELAEARAGAATAAAALYKALGGAWQAVDGANGG